jgi:hypothetical protein
MRKGTQNLEEVLDVRRHTAVMRKRSGHLRAQSTDIEMLAGQLMARAAR